MRTEHDKDRDALMVEIGKRFPECGYKDEDDREEANDILDLLDIYAPCVLLHPIAAGEFLRSVLSNKLAPDIMGLVRVQKDFEESRKLGFENEMAVIAMNNIRKEMADE